MRHAPSKILLTLIGLRVIIQQKRRILVTTAVSTSNVPLRECLSNDRRDSPGALTATICGVESSPLYLELVVEIAQTG
jgi:hypothetical protein